MINTRRLEKKWIFNPKLKDTLIQNLISSKLHFRPHFQLRSVNSIYFDTFNLRSAQHNLDGISDRIKTRIRWYGEDSLIIKEPKLEIKIKNNFLGHKKYYNFDTLKKIKIDNQNLLLVSSKVSKILKKKLSAISLVNYKRLYFISENQKIRATLDYDIRYKKLKDNIDNFFIKSNNIVLELKYHLDMDNFLRKNLNGITRVSKNSKYLNSLTNFFPNKI